jgi:hypothetical protein
VSDAELPPMTPEELMITMVALPISAELQEQLARLPFKPSWPTVLIL